MTIGIIKPILRDPAANPSCFPFRPAPALLVLFPIPIVLFPRQLHIPPFPDPKLRMILYRKPSGPRKSSWTFTFRQKPLAVRRFFLNFSCFYSVCTPKNIKYVYRQRFGADQRARAHPRTGRTADVLLRQRLSLPEYRPARCCGRRHPDPRRTAGGRIRQALRRVLAGQAHRKIRPGLGCSHADVQSAVRIPGKRGFESRHERAPREPRQVRLRGRTAQQARRRDGPRKNHPRKGSVTAACPKRSSCFTATATGTAPRSRNTSAKGRSTPPTATGR